MTEQKIAPVLSDDEISRMGETIRDEQYNEFCSWGQGYRRDSEGRFTIPLLPHILPRFARAIEQAVLARVGAVREWQPIETAPKDGTPIIVGDVSDGQLFDVVHGHFEVLTDDEEDGPWGIEGGEPFCSYVGRVAGIYFCNWLPGKEYASGWKINPDTFEYTHWIPAPAYDAVRALKGTPAAAVADAQPSGNAGELEALTTWPVLEKAAKAVENSAHVWEGFSMLDAKTCITAAIAASKEGAAS